MAKLETILLLSALLPITTMIVFHWHLRGSSPGSKHSMHNGPMAVTWVTAIRRQDCLATEAPHLN